MKVISILFISLFSFLQTQKNNPKIGFFEKECPANWSSYNNLSINIDTCLKNQVHSSNHNIDACPASLPERLKELSSSFVVCQKEYRDYNSKNRFKNNFLFKENRAPVILQATSNQYINMRNHSFFEYIIPAYAFKDPDGDPLTFHATLANGSHLPEWIEFYPDSRKFLGELRYRNPNISKIKLKVTAFDPYGKNASDVFFLILEWPTTYSDIILELVVGLIFIFVLIGCIDSSRNSGF